MIAYNHYIKFIPELDNVKKVEGFFSDVVTVQESTWLNLDEQLQFDLTFFNNQGRDLTLSTDREFSRTQKGQLWAFEVKDVVTFLWHSGTLCLEYIKHDYFTEKLLEYWCLHIVLPVFFTIEEIFAFLHAGAVEVKNRSILFIAPSMGGKSTMTDFFMKQGHRMISDDKVATYVNGEEIISVPSHPHHRPYREKEELGYFVDNFTSEIKPIYIIYVLEKAEADAAISITELLGIEKFKSLRYASETNLFFQKSKRFEYLTTIAKSTHIFKVIVPWDFHRLKNVYEKIVTHIRCTP